MAFEESSLMAMKRSLRVMLAVAACWGAAVRSVDACVCAGYTDVSPERQKRELKSEIDSARAVFVGELIARNSLMLRFRVQSVWKGDVGTEVVMSTGSRANSDGSITSSSCDVSFTFGSAYIVLAHGKTPEAMKAHACSSTGPVTAESLTALDALVKRRPPSAEVVPRQLVAVIGTVRNPGVVEWKPGLTVAQALALAGGPVRGASTGDCGVRRNLQNHRSPG